MNPLQGCEKLWPAGHLLLDPNEPDAAAAGACAFAIMTKAPRAGQVKTRLTPPLTPAEAAALNRCFLRDMSSAIAKIGGCSQGIACYTPKGEEETYKDLLPANFRLLTQRSGTLDERIIGAFQDLFTIGFGAACLVNSDSPLVAVTTFAEATRILFRPNNDVVIGPSDDGGYYLIGAQRLHRGLFKGIDWSTEHVLEQTLARAKKLQLTVHLLPACYDVDDPRALHRLCRELLGPNDRKDPRTAPATESFLREIIAREGQARLCADNSAN